MGACSTKITITDQLYLEMKSAPNDKLLLMFQLHYELYDDNSKKLIDELCQLSIMTDRSIHLDVSS